MPTIEHDPARGMFFARFPTGEAYLSYEALDDGVLDLEHTIVPVREQGRGVGESLVRAALDYARANDYRIVPTCPFVRAWIDAHPEALDLVATDY